MRPEERRAQLLGCALRAFARRGLGGARHADVAAEAAVSLPATFVYFRSREALVEAVLDEIERYYLLLVGGAARRDLPPRDGLLSIARAFAASVQTHPDHARVWLDWSTAVRDDLWPRYLRFEARCLRIIAGRIRAAQRAGTVDRRVHADDAAQIMYTAAYAVMQLRLRRTAPARLERFLASVIAAVAPPPRIPTST